MLVLDRCIITKYLTIKKKSIFKDIFHIFLLTSIIMNACNAYDSMECINKVDWLKHIKGK